MMETLKIKVPVHNGVALIPAEYAARLEGQEAELVVSLPDAGTTADESQEDERRWQLFADAAAKLTAMRAYRNIQTIEDAVIWQRRIRDDWEQPLPGHR